MQVQTTSSGQRPCRRCTHRTDPGATHAGKTPQIGRGRQAPPRASSTRGKETMRKPSAEAAASPRDLEGTCGNAAPAPNLKGCQAPPRVSSTQEKEGMASSSAAAGSPVNPGRVTVANAQHHPRRSSPATHCHHRPRPTEGAVHAELRVLGVKLSAILILSCPDTKNVDHARDLIVPDATDRYPKTRRASAEVTIIAANLSENGRRNRD